MTLPLTNKPSCNPHAQSSQILQNPQVKLMGKDHPVPGATPKEIDIPPDLG
jgi:hypothetical protein